jgi:outer membrane protein OmpA-like peptidoglycan-associated protein
LADAAFCAALVTLAGCSTLPDSYNPIEWAKDAQGWFDSDQKNATEEQRQAKEKLRGQEASAEPERFPKLATVPDRPKRSGPGETKKIADSLIADRANARYTDEVLRRQTDSPPRTAAGSGLRGPATPQPARPPATDAAAAAAAPTAPPAPVTRTVREAESLRGASTAARQSQVVEAAPTPPPQAPEASQPTSVGPPPPAQTTSRTAPVVPVEVAPPPPPPPMPAERSAAIPESPPLVGSTVGSSGSGQVAALPPAREEPPAPPIPPPMLPPPANVEPASDGRTIIGSEGRQALSRIPEPAPLIAALPPAGAQAPERPGEGQQIATVLFDDGSAEITPGAIKLLERVVALHRSRGGQLRVVGHASIDVPGGDALHKRLVNFRVSTDRANAVARELVRLGIDPSAISVVSVSESQPLYNERIPAGEAGNRRAEIYFEPRG